MERTLRLPDQDVIRQAPREEATGAPNERDFRTMAGCPMEIAGLMGPKATRLPRSVTASLAPQARGFWRSHGKWRADRLLSKALVRFAASPPVRMVQVSDGLQGDFSISEFPFHGNASAH